MKRVRLLLVRHGEAASNVEMLYFGRSDEPLTAKGREQAEALGRALAQVDITAAYTSPLPRARETAEVIGRATGHAPRVVDDLAEQSFGAWEGLTRAEVLSRGEASQILLRRLERDDAVAPPEGESRLELRRRVEAVVDARLADHDGGTIVLVSHVGPIKAILGQVLGLDAMMPMYLDPGTISVVDWGGRSTVRLFNSHAHLGWDRARWMAKPP